MRLAERIGATRPAAQPKLVPLEHWARSQYGEFAPTIYTLRRWVKDCKIMPAPEKHGRTYYVEESARYVDASKL